MTESIELACDPSRALSLVDDLTGAGDWLTILAAAEREDGLDVTDGDRPVWTVELRGRLGPMARSKRLRMVRTAHEPVLDGVGSVRFERHELDGRQHAPWVLEADVAPDGPGSRLTVHLHYGGSFGSGTLERVLRSEIERSRPRLVHLAAGGPDDGVRDGVAGA